MLARGASADFGERVAQHWMAVLDDGMHQAHAGMAVVGEGLGDLEIGERGDKFPLVSRSHPDLELLPARHLHKLTAWFLFFVTSCLRGGPMRLVAPNPALDAGFGDNL